MPLRRERASGLSSGANDLTDPETLPAAKIVALSTLPGGVSIKPQSPRGANR